MKKILLFISLVVFGFLYSKANNLNAFFSYSTFYTQATGPYVETYLSIQGSSIAYQLNENKKFQGSVEVIIIFKKGEEIINFQKYNLLSPEIEDTLSSFINFIDQQRFSLKENGSYKLELTITDDNSKDAPFKTEQELTIDFPTDKLFFSDIELTESITKSESESILTKSGFDVVPYVSSFFPENKKSIGFYAEIYNSDLELGKDEKYLVNYYIEIYEKNKQLGKYKRFVKQATKPANIIMGEFDISQLPSGNYNLVIEVRNKINELIETKKVFFQRSNPAVQINIEDIFNVKIGDTFVNKYSEDTLNHLIKTLYPISNPQERNFVRLQLKGDKIKANEKTSNHLELKQKFFLSFWLNRNQLDPELAWREYQEQLKKVNKNYRTQLKDGFETERGRVYLQYGPPNTIVDRPVEAGTYPYQIWHYYRTERRSNVRFVFANFNDAGGEYRLLHSEAYGEIMNSRWQYDLQKRNTPNTNLDDPGNLDNQWGSGIDFFNNPR